MPHYPKDWLPILLLITMIAYSVSVAVIEDGTPEEEDLAKALALSKRFFWRTMMEEWDCDKGQGELQLSPAMEAIKAAYRVLFGLREEAGLDTEFDFENESDFLNEPMLSPKGILPNFSLFEACARFC
uniref:Uncharacterized protein n=1 Tax=Globodera pallida TaxID=36090 RepID=A0A183C9V7_GLOPA